MADLPRTWLSTLLGVMFVAGPVGAAPDSPAAMLAEQGRSVYQIVTAADAPPATRYAAEELQHFLRQITGATLPVVSDAQPPQPHEILVGPSRRLDVLGVALDRGALGAEGYLLRTIDARLVIVGGLPRGTLYGVYCLLEEHLGCRWFTPEVARIPRQARLALPQLDQRRIPTFEYREQYLWESYDAAWMARNRLNGAGGRDRLFERQQIEPPVLALDARHGGSIRFGRGFFVHTFESIIPREAYFAEHPEYFALRKGQRKPTQLCCTNPAVIETCRSVVLGAMRAQPEATVFSLSQNDNRDYCECPQCQALAAAEQSQMAPVLQLVNRVAEAAAREFPGKIVETLAYQWTRKPPQSLRPAPNVVIRLCDIECCFAHPLAAGCTSANQSFVADLQAWSRISQRLWIWDYTTNYAHYLLPLPNKRLLDDNLRLFAANHVTGVFEQGTYDTPDSEMAALKGYLLAKFLWDPQSDEKTATREFLEAYYGPAAGAVQQYLDLIQDYVVDHPVHVGIYARPTHAHLPPELLLEASGLWDAAETQAASAAAALDRVQRSRMSLDYTIAEQAQALVSAGKGSPALTPAQQELLALARRRFAPFAATFQRSGLTRIREWQNVDKAVYLAALAIELGLGVDPQARAEAQRKAQQFLDNEQQFHLGVLPTEQSNPKSVGLAESAGRNLEAAIAKLQAVDGDIPPKAAAVLAGPEFARLVEALQRTLDRGGRICFSGCGATGRLSILLEAAWRRACQELQAAHPTVAPRLASLEQQVVSIMTGGDYALIRSVENFEDHAVFGRRQVQESKLGPGDVLVAISEGGETSSVIGTIHQALDNGATAFFLFNNPADVLAKHIERSRQIIADPRVTKLDLTTGPMAVAGSTRMQATTVELLVAGAALERAFLHSLEKRFDVAARARLPLVQTAPTTAERFNELLTSLSRPEAVAALAAMVRFEADLYRRHGLVTYMADAALLDIFTDTTERSPTFMLPRFRKCDDHVSPPSWAMVKNPLLPTAEAWRDVLGRAPRCLAWTADTYRELQAPAALQQNPPALSADEMLKFTIGKEDDAARYAVADNAAVLVALGAEVPGLAAADNRLRTAFQAASRPFAAKAILAISPAPPPAGVAGTVWHVPLDPWASPLRLGDRIAAKLVLNTVSTATMARMGRLASNWMAYVEPTNKKLIDRGTRLVAQIAGVDYKTACCALHETIEYLALTTPPGAERPSPVAITIARLKRR